jgi:hypothetical protein
LLGYRYDPGDAFHAEESIGIVDRLHLGPPRGPAGRRAEDERDEGLRPITGPIREDDIPADIANVFGDFHEMLTGSSSNDSPQGVPQPRQPTSGRTVRFASSAHRHFSRPIGPWTVDAPQ